MDGKTTCTAAGELGEAKRRFERWRRSRERRERIPDELWQLAVRVATVHGVSGTARRLGLNPTKLKEQMETRTQGHAAEQRPRFVELPWLGAAPVPECLLEAEDAAGRKLRIHLKAGATAQVVLLSRLLWREEG
jgi:hypothetical protein